MSLGKMLQILWAATLKVLSPSVESPVSIADRVPYTNLYKDQNQFLKIYYYLFFLSVTWDHIHYLN